MLLWRSCSVKDDYLWPIANEMVDLCKIIEGQSIFEQSISSTVLYCTATNRHYWSVRESQRVNNPDNDGGDGGVPAYSWQHTYRDE